MDEQRELVIERVLRCVERVPAGRVASYGAIGRITGVGPRQVGAIMQRWSDGLPWWRITSHAGELPAGLLDRARQHWRDEGIAEHPNGRGCRYRAHEADLAALEAEWRAAVADLPTPD